MTKEELELAVKVVFDNLPREHQLALIHLMVNTAQDTEAVTAKRYEAIIAERVEDDRRLTLARLTHIAESRVEEKVERLERKLDEAEERAARAERGVRLLRGQFGRLYAQLDRQKKRHRNQQEELGRAAAAARRRAEKPLLETIAGLTDALCTVSLELLNYKLGAAK